MSSSLRRALAAADVAGCHGTDDYEALGPGRGIIGESITSMSSSPTQRQ